MIQSHYGLLSTGTNKQQTKRNRPENKDAGPCQELLFHLICESDWLRGSVGQTIRGGLNCLTRNRILFFQSTILKMKINPGTSNSRKTCPQEAIEGKNQRCRSWWDSVSLLFSEI